MASKVDYMVTELGKFIFVARGNRRSHGYSRADIIRVLKTCRNHVELAKHYRVSVMLARKILTLAEIDYLHFMYKCYQKGTNCREIARQNGIQAGKLSKLFAARGWSVERGRPKIKFKRKVIQKTWQRTKTIRQFSKQRGIHWATGKRVLCKFVQIQALEISMPTSLNQSSGPPT